MLANLAPILRGPARSEYGARVVPAGEVKVLTGEPVTSAALSSGVIIAAG
jgi:hypothetical protein